MILRQISNDGLRAVLKEHKLWLKDTSNGKRADLSKHDLRLADLRLAELRLADLSRPDLSRADLIRADLRDAELKWADLSGADLREANMEEADLRGCSLRLADLRGAKLRHADLRLADLCSANLSEADLNGTDLVEANLREAKLRGADLSRADLGKADMEEANLRGAQLSKTNLSGTKLTKADLKWASLSGVKLREALLSGADFEGAFFSRTKVARREDLVTAKNIESFEGFVFDEEDDERVQAESKERDKRAEETLNVEDKGYITFTLPNSYGPAQLGRVLVLSTLLYEGIRIALTAPFESLDDLWNKVTKPELYGAYEDRYSLRLDSIKQGSWVGELIGQQGVTGFIIDLMTMPKTIKLKNLQLQNEIDRLETNDDVEGTDIPKSLPARITRRQLSIITEEQRHIVDEKITNRFGEIDHIDERRNVALNILEHSASQLLPLLSKMGGEIKIDGEPFKMTSDDYTDEGDEATDE